MADEVVNTTPQDTATVTDVTDDALSSAWDATQGNEVTAEVTEEVVEQTQNEEPDNQIPDEPTDNAERSRLGRRMKGVEETLNKIQQALESLSAGNPTQQTVSQPAQATTTTYDNSYMESQLQDAIEKGIIPDTIITPLDQIKVKNFMDGLEQRANLEYQKGYIGYIKSSELKGSTPDDLHSEVIAELFKVDSPYNQKRYGNPSLDARINYLEAKNAILEGRITTTGKNVFKGKNGNVPTGTHVTTKIAQEEVGLPPLDEASLQFIKSQGMSDEAVKKALKEPMPLHLRSKL